MVLRIALTDVLDIMTGWTPTETVSLMAVTDALGATTRLTPTEMACPTFAMFAPTIDSFPLPAVSRAALVLPLKLNCKLDVLLSW
jgi:hypothetical protein